MRPGARPGQMGSGQMKLVRYEVGGAVAYGVLEGETVKELRRSYFDGIEETGKTRKLSEVRLLAPTEPSKIVAIGLNYKGHAAESKKEIPDEPQMFFKPSTAVIGPGDAIIYPKISERVDYEAELGVVIGKRARFVSREKAKEYILGYTCCNDVSARDLQRRDVQFARAKGIDTFAPIGPCIATDIDPTSVLLEAVHNGKVVQSTNTADMVFDVYDLMQWVTEVFTLLPGDVISTGTPAGIGPMQVGDTIEIRIEGIGSLVNTISS